MSKQCNTGALRMPLLLTIKEEKVGVKCHCSQDCRHIENKKKRAMKTQSILCLTAVLFATLTNGQLHSSSKRSDEGANKKWLAKKRDYTSFLKLFSRDLQRKWKQPCLVQKKTATKQTNSNTTRLCWRSYSFLLHFLLTARQRQQPALRYARATRSIKTRFL